MFETIFCTLSWLAIVVMIAIAGLEWLIMHNWQMAGVWLAFVGIVFYGNVVIAVLIAGDYLLASSAGFFFLFSCFAARLLFVSNSNRQGAAA